MVQCPNCGQKTYGNSCQWCRYPLIRRRFPWQARRGTQLKKIAEQVKLEVKQVDEDAREKAKKEAEKESVRIVAKSKQNTEKLAKETKWGSEIKAERIIEKDTRKMKKDAGKNLGTAMGKAEKAAEQIAEQMPPSRVKVTDKIKVFITDDQDLFRQGLRLFLSQTDDIELIGESDFLEYTVAIIEGLMPNLVLIDMNLPWLSGLGLAHRVSQCSPDIPVIMLTSYEDDDQIFEALKTGVAGYLSKGVTPERLVSAIRRVFRGEHVIDELLVRPGVAQRVLKQLQGMEKEGLIKPLRPREMEILGYFASGHSHKQVAHAIGMSEQQITQRMASIVSEKLVTNGRSP